MTPRAARPDIVLLAWLPLAACGMLPCGLSPCGSDGALAELTQTAAGVDRDFAADVATWSATAVGDRFHMGDGLRTPAGEVALLALLPSGGMRVESKTIVRFQRTPGKQGGPNVGVESGEIVLDTGESAIGVDTGRGVARVAPGSRVRVGAGDKGVNLRVMVGALRLEGQDGEVRLGAGEELTVRVGDLLLEDGQPPPPTGEVPTQAAPADAGAAPAQPDTLAAQQVTQVGGQSNPFANPPPRVDLVLASGETAFIHDPAPPTAVEIPTDCPGEALIEIGRGAGYGLGSARSSAGGVRATLGAGGYNYRVRCDSGEQKRGRVVIRRDPGTRRLPRTPPRVTVDADGRPYTVRYQNLLPEITFAWPRPPEATSYELRLTRRGRSQKHKGSKPRIALPSGKVGEGTHQFTFRAADKVSKQGILKVAFDNTASAAYVSSPTEGSAKPGVAVTVSGAALAGSSIRVGTATAATTKQGRFRIDVTPTAGTSSLAIRVQHPASGVHYYLRHLAY